MEELRWLDATEVAGLIADGAVSPREVLDATITRIEDLDPAVHAVVTPLFERSIGRLAALSANKPFGGVAFLVKDLICEVGGAPFHEGMRYLRGLGYVPPVDQELFRRFEASGLVAVGKANTAELGLIPTTEPLAMGPTRNPWNHEHTPGGSSGGPAAAVAVGMVPIAHANDGGGSIRGPAAYCGLVGLKPSRGRVPLGPLYGDLFGGLVSEFAVTRTVRDTAAALDAVAGPMPGDPYAAPTTAGSYTAALNGRADPLRVGLWTGIPGGRSSLAPCVVDAVRNAGSLLEDLGHTVIEDHPASLDGPEASGVVSRMFCVAALWAIRRWERICGHPVNPDDLEPMTRTMVDAAAGISGADVMDLLETAQLIGRGTAAWHDKGFDILVMASTPDVAPPLGTLQAAADDDVRRATKALLPLVSLLGWCNLTGQPAISLPLSTSPTGLPIGIQLVAPYGREDRLLAVAAQLETAAPWSARHPRDNATQRPVD